MKKTIIIILLLLFITSVAWGEEFSESDIKHASIGDVIYRSIKTTFPSSSRSLLRVTYFVDKALLSL